MFQVNFYKNDKLIGTQKYPSLEKAEQELDNSDHYQNGDYYEIVNDENGEIIQDAEIVDPDDILDDMFDGEDSKEGFDWTLGD